MARFGYGYSVQECFDLASDFATQLDERSKDKALSIKWMKGIRDMRPEKKVHPKSFGACPCKMAEESVLRSTLKTFRPALKSMTWLISHTLYLT